MERASKKRKAEICWLSKVPKDVIINHLFVFLSVKDVLATGATCKWLRDTVNQPSLWILLLNRDFSVKPGKNDGNVKLVYISEFMLHPCYGNMHYNYKMLHFFSACENGHLLTVKYFLRHGVDPSDYNSYGFRWACVWGHIEIAKLLLSDKRTNPCAFNNFAFREACNENHHEIVELLSKDKRIQV